MFVCNCNGIREKDVQSACQKGATRPSQVYKAMDCQPQCRKCVPQIRNMLALEANAQAA